MITSATKAVTIDGFEFASYPPEDHDNLVRDILVAINVDPDKDVDGVDYGLADHVDFVLLLDFYGAATRYPVKAKKVADFTAEVIRTGATDGRINVNGVDLVRFERNDEEVTYIECW